MLGIDHLPQGGGRAIHRDATFGNQRLCLAARGDPRLSQCALQPHRALRLRLWFGVRFGVWLEV